MFACIFICEVATCIPPIVNILSSGKPILLVFLVQSMQVLDMFGITASKEINLTKI